MSEQELSLTSTSARLSRGTHMVRVKSGQTRRTQAKHEYPDT